LDVVDPRTKIDRNCERFLDQRIHLHLQIGQNPVFLKVLFHLIPQT
jgi:hypothetical protein